jgi:hypothetical protein
MRTVKHSCSNLPVTALWINAKPTEFELALSHTRASLSNNTFATLLTTFIASDIKSVHLVMLILDKAGRCKRVAMTLGV